MLSENKRAIFFLIALLVIGLLLIGISFFRQLSFPDNVPTIEKGKKIELSVGDSLEQKFIAKNNGLNKIEILFGSKKLKKNYSLQFILADKDCQKIIRQKTLAGEYSFNSKYLYGFNFSKIKNSQNKNYCLKIKYFSKLTKEQIDPKNKIRIFAQSENEELGKEEKKDKIKPGNSGDLVINLKSGQEKVILQNLSFRTSYTEDSVFKSLQKLNQRISQYKPWFLKGGYLNLIVVLMVIGSGYSVWLLFKK